MNDTENKEKKNGFVEWLSNNVQKIVIAVVSVIYITQGIFKLATKDTTPLEIIGNIGMSVIIGVIISNSLNNMGLTNGRRSEVFIASSLRYGETKKNAVQYMDKLANWCDFKNHQELETKKKEIIQSAGLNWKAFKCGFYDEHKEKLANSQQQKAYYAAKRCKIYKLNSQELLSDVPSKYSLFQNSKFGQSEQEYKRRNVVMDFISKVGIGVVCGMYSLVPLITEDNAQEIMSGVLWNTAQISMWLIFGMNKYFNAKSFMEDEYRQTHIILKTEYLNEFIVTMQNNPSVIEEFDDEKEIDAFIEDFIKRKEQEKLQSSEEFKEQEKLKKEQEEKEYEEKIRAKIKSEEEEKAKREQEEQEKLRLEQEEKERLQKEYEDKIRAKIKAEEEEKNNLPPENAEEVISNEKNEQERVLD